jgi:aspartyl-tRNA(Asn)/glutamyl-tRNA(Gln) amidotransferase subunit C
MPISKLEVAKIAELARLELSDDETESFAEQLSSILEHIEKLNELDIGSVQPMSHCSSPGEAGDCARREDIVKPSLGQRIAVENAPDAEAGYFRVPRVIGG